MNFEYAVFSGNEKHLHIIGAVSEAAPKSPVCSDNLNV